MSQHEGRPRTLDRAAAVFLAAGLVVTAALLVGLGCGSCRASDPPADATPPPVTLRLALAHHDDGAILALIHTIPPGWHIGWENPGDAGLPTSVEVIAPSGVTAGPLRFPAPEITEEAGLATYAHHGDARFVIALRGPPKGDLTVTSRWLLCRDICVPGEATVTLMLAIEQHPAEARAALSALPRPPTAHDGVSVSVQGSELTISVAAADRVRFAPDLALEALLTPTRPSFVRQELDGPRARWTLRATLAPPPPGATPRALLSVDGPNGSQALLLLLAPEPLP